MNIAEFALDILLRQSPGFELSKEKFINVTDKSFYTDGPKVKFGIAQEECAELIQAISKLERSDDTEPRIPLYGDDLRLHILEEMADLYICLRYLRLANGFSDADISAAIDVKLDREMERLENVTVYENQKNS